MKKILLMGAVMLLALPMTAAAAGGLVGDCYDCHSMHASEQGSGMVRLGDGTMTRTPLANLLRHDCISCHANTPEANGKLYQPAGGAVIPQVAHAGTIDNSLAGGNFSYVTAGGSLGGDSRKGHNVSELFGPNGAIGNQVDNNEGPYNEPPGLVHTSDRGAFTVDTSFDAFTCAGARGCHGTRDQLLSGDLEFSTNTDGNFVTGNNLQMRVGITAISGAHHDSYDGAKNAANPANNTEAIHDGGSTNGYNDTGLGAEGYGVADGYRFIRGLKGYGNTLNRWENNDGADHNEYYGVAGGMGSGCGACHLGGSTVELDNAAVVNSDATLDIWSERMDFDSTIITPNNSMSGFCSSCHGVFHSGGGGDYVDNGTSGAFLRHPSDYVIPGDVGSEYAAYTEYVMSAPVARPDLLTASNNVVNPGTDLVMCLSCHFGHASDKDYMLRFDYTAMEAGIDGFTPTQALALGGCLACHSEKGALPENR